MNASLLHNPDGYHSQGFTEYFPVKKGVLYRAESHIDKNGSTMVNIVEYDDNCRIVDSASFKSAGTTTSKTPSIALVDLATAEAESLAIPTGGRCFEVGPSRLIERPINGDSVWSVKNGFLH